MRGRRPAPARARRDMWRGYAARTARRDRARRASLRPGRVGGDGRRREARRRSFHGDAWGLEVPGWEAAKRLNGPTPTLPVRTGRGPRLSPPRLFRGGESGGVVG